MSPGALITAIWEQNRALLITVFSLGLLSFGLLLYQGLIVNDRLIDLRIEQANLQQKIRQQQAEHAGSDVLATEAEQITDELHHFQTLIPEKSRFSTFIGEVFSWAKQTGLNLDQINYSPKVIKDSPFLQYGLSFAVKGEYEQLKRFIHLLENSERILIIDKINLSGSDNREQNKPGVQLQIQLTTYFREGGQ